jgi:hypothetical protein
MKWEVILVLLIPLAVWILGAIFAGVNQTPPQQPTTRDNPRRRPRQSANELDEFLNQARERRNPAGQRRPRPAPKEEPQSQSRNDEPANDHQVARPALPSERKAPPTIIRNTEPQPRAEPTNNPQPSPSQPSTEQKPAPAPAVLEKLKAKPVPPVLAEISRLLRDPKGRAAALVLREIFDRPLSAR